MKCEEGHLTGAVVVGQAAVSKLCECGIESKDDRDSQAVPCVTENTRRKHYWFTQKESCTIGRTSASLATRTKL